MTVILQRSGDFDTATLRAAVDGQSDRIAPGPALTLLLGSGYPGTRQVIERLLREPTRSENLRAHAAALVARTGGPRGAAILLSALGDAAPRVRLEAVKGLGRIGGASSLEHLLKLAGSSRGLLRRQAQYAALLIAAREGLPGRFLGSFMSRERFPVACGCAEQANIRRAAREEFDAAIADLADEPLGIDFDEATSLRISGGDLSWILLLNTDRRSLLASGTVNVLLGAVAEWDGSGESWHHAYTLIAGPANARAARNLAAIDVTGHAAFCGSLRLKQHEGAFDLAAASPLALPAEISGTISRLGIEISRFDFNRAHSGRQKASRTREQISTEA